MSIVEPGAYATEFGGPASGKFAAGLDIYGDLKAQVVERMKTMQRGDPKATPDATFMCGRYATKRNKREIAEAFQVGKVLRNRLRKATTLHRRRFNR